MPPSLRDAGPKLSRENMFFASTSINGMPLMDPRPRPGASSLGIGTEVPALGEGKSDAAGSSCITVLLMGRHFMLST